MASAASPAAASSSHTPPQQFSPPIPLSKRTSSRHAIRDTFNDYAHTTGSPPSTPPPRRRKTHVKDKGKQPLRAHASAEDYRRRDTRHSHGLSWSSTTRDSVVDNLLFSLDNLSRPDLSDDHEEDRAIQDAEFDRQKYVFTFGHPANTAIAKTQRTRGHTYSSSSSSVFARPDMTSSPSSYADTPRGRRSNSSSNFGIQHQFSAKIRASRHRGTSSLSTDTQKPVVDARGELEGRDMFDAPLVDYGYSTITSNSNIRRNNRRSLSMDQMNEMFTNHKLGGGETMLNRGRPVPSVFSPFDTDGAPEPMIAAGPRKQQNPGAVGPVYVNQAPSKSNSRKVTTQTDLRSASMPMPSPPIPQNIRNQADEFVRANSMRGIPQIPGQDKPLPSPALSRQNVNSAHSGRERPGFFKRVFGGSSSRNSGSSDHVDGNMGYGDLASAPARNSSSGGTQSRTGTRHSSKEHNPQTNGVSYPPPSLNKKPSSFFRRRKKSASENGPPPPLPVTNGVANQTKVPSAAEPSPSVSSLRKVMDPFLASERSASKLNLAEGQDDLSRPTTQESTEDSDTLDIFHSGYTPPPDASLGKRNPLTRLSTDTEKGKGSKEGSREEEGKKMKVRKRKNEMLSPLAQESLASHKGRDRSKTSPSQVSPALVSPMVDFMPNEAKDTRPVSRASTGDRIIASKGFSPVEQEVEMRTSRMGSNTTDDSGFVRQSEELSPGSNKSERLYIMPTASEEKLSYNIKELPNLPEPIPETSSLKSPAYHTATSTTFPAGIHSPTTPSPETPFYSATSLPLVQIDGMSPRKSHDANGLNLPSQADIVDEGAEYRDRARKIFNGDEEDVTKPEAASWLGERNTLSTKTLEAYMQLFDFTGFNILVALRLLCGKLVLKGETQQFDRIITALSYRWCECNPHHGFKAQDVVHTICYSLILLNTDLHLADIGEKMSRSAYVKNTLPTIKRVAMDAAPSAFDDTIRPKPAALSRPGLPWSDSNNSNPPHSPASPNDRTSFDTERPSQLKRLSIRPNFDRQDSDGCAPDSTITTGPSNALSALVNAPWNGGPRGWEFEVENILKSFYASIRSDPLPLHGGPPRNPAESQPVERNLSVQNFASTLKRTASVVSKAPSDNMSSRSMAGLRSMTMGFQNKYSRTRPKVYPNSTYGSSGTSFDDGSVWSPGAGSSSGWSKYSTSKTLTSASMQSLGTAISSVQGRSEFGKHSIGFANALSQAIIREENQGALIGDSESISLSVPGGLLEDEALALEGAPWAKEGMVQHKHHLETSGRKAKERTWNSCFAVIGKGKLTLFAFNTSSSKTVRGPFASSRSQTRPPTAASTNGTNGTNTPGTSSGQAVVGGGSWMSSASQLATFALRQTIASVLPPPGYSKTRPHVWALSLPTGAVHLFQVGTPEIAAEFMTTANYWAARLSKEPLSGGVSNVEYGWSESIVGAAPERAVSPPVPHPPSAMANRATPQHTRGNSNVGGIGIGRPSFQSSIRGSFDTGIGERSVAGFNVGSGSGGRTRLPGDKVALAEWTSPSQSLMASQLMEVDQLRALRAYVEGVEGELAGHNVLKGGMEGVVSCAVLLARHRYPNADIVSLTQYSSRHANYARAMTNWQRKSDHLLREIVKFQTYIDSLSGAQKAKEAVFVRKEEREAAKRAREGGADGGAVATPSIIRVATE